MGRSKKNRSSAYFNHWMHGTISSTKIISLPNELLGLIFLELPAADRVDVGKACKRFREIDLELGKRRFDCIDVSWTSEAQILTLSAPHFKREIRGDRTRPIGSPFRHETLLKKAHTNLMKIQYVAPDNDVTDEIPPIPDVVAAVTYRKLDVHLLFATEHVEDFIPSLINGRDLSSANLRLCFESVRSPHLVARTRAMLMRLPRLAKLKLKWSEAYGLRTPLRPEECLLDDKTLLHIATCTSYASLKVDAGCTTAGVLAAFELVCESPLASKYLALSVHASRIYQLFSLPHPPFERELLKPYKSPDSEIHRVVDRARHAVLMMIGRCRSTFERVEIGKMDATGGLVHVNDDEMCEQDGYHDYDCDCEYRGH